MGPKRVISAKFSKIVRGSRQKIWTLFNGITEEEKRKCTIDFSKQGKESFFPRNVKKEGVNDGRRLSRASINSSDIFLHGFD